jgi:hypothetical protein
VRSVTNASNQTEIDSQSTMTTSAVPAPVPVGIACAGCYAGGAMYASAH